MSKRNTLAVAATTAALLGGGLVFASPAEAACFPNNWGATNTAGDIVGAYAHGQWCELSSGPTAGRIDVNVTLKDTDGDGRAACAQLHATYADGGTRDEWVYNGKGAGEEAYAAYSFASSVRKIWVREGLGNGGTCTVMASGVHTFYSA
ncbi:hypothetical protein ABZ611_21685 [Streptomyces sp. NPDC007861]|uniref:hypothetical protein n=1 Tax=Streptomyces sp. NPDC007861 TaxID=3154893 RepID=UPI0033D2AC91